MSNGSTRSAGKELQKTVIDAEADDGTNLRSHGTMQHVKDYMLLVQFIVPLIITQIAPDAAEQALNRGLTSVATEEMEGLLASFGLAYSILKLIIATNDELRQLSLVLSTTKRNYRKNLFLCITVGIICALLLCVLGLSNLGTLLFEGLHQVKQEVSDEAKMIFLYLLPIPLLHGLAKYHEGLLIYRKHTFLVGVLNMLDTGLQIAFTMVLLFLPTRTDPILIPIFSVYAGYIGRAILSVGFYYVLVHRLLEEGETTVTVSQGLLFWMPLALTRGIAFAGRPVLNLFVARNQAPYGRAESALAIVNMVLPVARVTYAFLIELRVIIPAFFKETTQHRKYKFSELFWFGTGVVIFSFAFGLTVFWIPGSSYAIMRNAMGMTEELARQSVTPLKILAFSAPFTGFRCFVSGWLIFKKYNIVAAAGAIVRLCCNVATLVVGPYIGVNGPEMGAASVVFGYFGEGVTVISLASLIKRFYKPKKRDAAHEKINGKYHENENGLAAKKL